MSWHWFCFVKSEYDDGDLEQSEIVKLIYITVDEKLELVSKKKFFFIKLLISTKFLPIQTDYHPKVSFTHRRKKKVTEMSTS